MINPDSDLDIPPKEARAVVYKNAISMLERLNALIAMIEKSDSPDLKFVETTIEKCWELGSQLCVFGGSLDDDEEQKEQWELMGEAIGDFLGGP
jgi:hypothetical protein